jgi:hypothetical protein
MKLRSLLAATALAAAAFAGSYASATTYGTISTTDGNTALGPLGLSDPLGGYFGGNLYLTGGPADIQITFLGSEAGFNNRFNFEGTTLFSTGGGDPSTGDFGSPVSTLVSGVTAGLLDFWFGANQDAASVTNGSNPDNSTSAANFFVSFLPDAAATFGQSVLIFFDDAGGGAEDNHDDMVIRLDLRGGAIAPIPLPAGGLLLIGALGGLALIRRRKST